MVSAARSSGKGLLSRVKEVCICEKVVSQLRAISSIQLSNLTDREIARLELWTNDELAHQFRYSRRNGDPPVQETIDRVLEEISEGDRNLRNQTLELIRGAKARIEERKKAVAKILDLRRQNKVAEPAISLVKSYVISGEVSKLIRKIREQINCYERMWITQLASDEDLRKAMVPIPTSHCFEQILRECLDPEVRQKRSDYLYRRRFPERIFQLIERRSREEVARFQSGNGHISGYKELASVYREFELSEHAIQVELPKRLGKELFGYWQVRSGVTAGYYNYPEHLRWNIVAAERRRLQEDQTPRTPRQIIAKNQSAKAKGIKMNPEFILDLLRDHLSPEEWNKYQKGIEDK